jgi:hypothetical protein
MMEARLAHEAPIELWDPTAELHSLDNQAYFAQILPRLQTVQVVRNGNLPAVAESSRGYILSEVGPKLPAQNKLLSANEAVAAFAPNEVIVDQESAQEEAFVLSLHLSLIQGALTAASNGFASFEAANQDMVLLLGSLNRPTHRYRQLSETRRNFMDRYYNAAHNSNSLSGDQLKSWRHAMSLLVYNAVVDPPIAVRNLAAEANSAAAEQEATVYQLHPEERTDMALEQVKVETAWGEIDFPASPWLNAFLKEFRYNKHNLPRSTDEAIQQANMADSNLGASKSTKELMGRLGIAAYIETLATDAEQQKVNGTVAHALTFITKNEDGVSARIIQLSNRVSQMARATLREQSDALELPIKANQFPQLEEQLESLPRAFSVLRLVMTRLGQKPVTESQVTRELGDVVEKVLAAAYPKVTRRITE